MTRSIQYFRKARFLGLFFALFPLIFFFGGATWAQLPCDYDGDGECNPGDLDLMYANWGVSGGIFDADGSGKVDKRDIVAWKAQASDPANPYRPFGASDPITMADVDLNRSVDENDIGILLNWFGDENRLHRQGNLNDDRFVDGKDLGILLNEFLQTEVAEPSSITFGSSTRPVDPRALIADPQLAGATTFDLSLSSLTDVMVIETELTVVEGSLYQTSIFGGSNVSPPQAFILPLSPELHADSWITTPGFTTTAGGNEVDEVGTLVTHFDTQNTGAQIDFNFARLTLVPETPGGDVQAILRVTAQARTDDPFPDCVKFEYVIGVPEPHSLTLLAICLMSALPMVRKRRLCIA